MFHDGLQTSFKSANPNLKEIQFPESRTNVLHSFENAEFPKACMEVLVLNLIQFEFACLFVLLTDIVDILDHSRGSWRTQRTWKTCS